MAWSKINKAPLPKSERRDTPDGLWQKCSHCNEINFRREFESNLYVCLGCGYHYPIPAKDRILSFVDEGSFEEYDADLESSDPLGFVDQKPYSARLKDAQAKSGTKDAIVCGRAKLFGQPIHLGVYHFQFMGGSMGSVVGEKIARVFNRALKSSEPAIIFSASGGARMQEGLLSLMQMAKTCVALGQLRDHKIPMISVMCNPTTGGVAASYAMLGDINIAEPGALIGFAGPRVIRQTIGENLPEGFQTSEYLLKHGMMDMIVTRHNMRKTVSQMLQIILAAKRPS